MGLLGDYDINLLVWRMVEHGRRGGKSLRDSVHAKTAEAGDRLNMGVRSRE